MAINLNDNLKINVGNPIDSKYLNSGNTAYSGTTLVDAKNAVVTAIPVSQRYLGLTVLLSYTGATNVEYWWKESVTGTTENLIEKKFASEQFVGDFVTGATNLGYFSGLTGIQMLDLSGTGFTSNVGSYYSEYNWYYADADGIIRIGSPTHNGPLRRAYINSLRTKSWIWDEQTGGWEISLNDVVAEVGNSINYSPHYDYVFTGTTWNVPDGNVDASVTPYGSLTTGSTITIGNPVYKNKSDQDLNFRTPISDTPEILGITNDDNYVRFSANTGIQLLTASNGLTKVGQDVRLGGTLTGTTALVLTGSSSLTITDSRVTPSGLTYADDYSASFTDRSLIDKGYLSTISLSGGERIYKIINQPLHGFAVNNVIGWSGGTYNKAIADGTYDGEVIGIVTAVPNADNFEVTQAGYVTGLTPTLTINTTYFLSATVAGQLTSTEPIVPEHINKSVLITTSGSSGWVLPYAGYVITSGITQGGALIRSVCNISASPYAVTSSDYYIGAQGADIIQLTSNINGQVVVVDDVCGNAAVGCEIQISGVFFGGSSTAYINTPYGSMTFIYNGAKAKWSSIGISTAPY